MYRLQGRRQRENAMQAVLADLHVYTTFVGDEFCLIILLNFVYDMDL